MSVNIGTLSGTADIEDRITPKLAGIVTSAEQELKRLEQEGERVENALRPMTEAVSEVSDEVARSLVPSLDAAASGLNDTEDALAAWRTALDQSDAALDRGGDALREWRQALDEAQAGSGALRTRIDGLVATVRGFSMDKAAEGLSSFGTQLQETGKSLQGVGEKFSTAGNAALPMSAAITAAGGAAFAFGKSFEANMMKVETLSGVSAEAVAHMRDGILALAPVAGIGPRALSEALLVVTSTGIRGAGAMDILTMAAKASAVGLGDTKDIAKAVTAAITAYGSENLTAATATEVLFKTVREGGAEASELAGTLGRVVGIASQVGVSFQEVGAFMATFTRLGVDSAEAVTALRGVLATVQKPSEEARKQLEGMGWSIDGLRRAIKENGLTSALIELVTRTKGNDEAIAAIVPNVRALAGVMGTAGAQAKAMADVQRLLTQDTHDLEAAFVRVGQTTEQQWNQQWAKAEKIAITTFGAFKDELKGVALSLTPVIDLAGSVIEKMDEWEPSSKRAVFALATMGALAGPGMIAVGSALKVTGFALEGLGTSAVQTSKYLGVLRNGAVALGVAIAAWEVGTWIGNLKLFGGEVQTLSEKVEYYTLRLQGVSAADAELVIGSRRRLESWQQEQKAVQDLASGFSGPEVLKKAQNYEKALISVGGASKLTKEEQKQFAAVFDQVIEKYKAMGPEGASVVQHFQELRKQVEPAKQATGKYSEEVQKLIEQYSGGGLLTEGNNYAVTLRAIGGATKLTADEQKAFGKVFDEVIAKYKAMGPSGAKVVQQFEALRAQLPLTGKALDFVTASSVNWSNTMPKLDVEARKHFNTVQGLTEEGYIPLNEESMEVVTSSMDVARALAKVKDNGEEVRESLSKPGFFGGLTGGLKSVWEGLSGGNGISGMLSNIGGGIANGIGQMISGGISSMISAGLGLAVQGIKKLFGGPSAQELEGRKSAESFRKGLLDGLNATQMREVREAVSGAWAGNEAGAATVIALRDAYREVGRSASEAQADADRLFRAEKQGASAVAVVMADINAKLDEQKAKTTFLNDTVPNALKAVSDSGSLVTAEFASIVRRLDEMGAASASINQFMIGQAGAAVAGIATTLNVGATALQTLRDKETQLNDLRAQASTAEGARRAELQQQITALTAEIGRQAEVVQITSLHSQNAATAMSGAVVASFDEMTRRGMTVTAALAQMQPAITDLGTQLQATGFTGGAAFEEVRAMAALASDQVAGPALQAVDGLKQSLTGLQNTGILNQDMFSGLTDQITQTFDSLIEQGFSGDRVMRLMQPTLQRIWELEQDFEYKVDDATQELLTQAETAGLVGDAHRDASSIATQAMTDAAVAMQNVAATLERVFGTATEQADGFASNVTDAIGRIPRRVEIDVVGIYRAPDVPSGGGSNSDSGNNPDLSGLNVTPMAGGGSGVVTEPTLFLAGENYRAEAFAFAGAGNRSFGSGSDPAAAQAMSRVHGEIAGLRRDMTHLMPMLMEQAARHGAQTAGRRL